MEQLNFCEFVTHADIDNNFIRMHSNCRLQASLLRAMHDGDEKLCDVSLFGVPPSDIPVTSLRPIRAHKIVLAYASKHLYELLTSDEYTDSHLPEYYIENIAHENLRRIVNFIYTDCLTIPTENAVDAICGVLADAKYLVMTNLFDACEAYLADEVKPENCIKLWHFARKYGCLSLLHATSTFIARNLADMLKYAEFLRMPYENYAKLLLSEAFVAANEDQRCLAALAWLEYEEIKRAPYVGEIIGMVPFDSVSANTALTLNESKMLWKHASDTMRTLMTVLQTRTKRTHPVFEVCDVLPRAYYTGWYVIGGYCDSKSKFLHYDVNQKFWNELPALSDRRNSFGACRVGNRILAIGGDRNGDATGYMDEYNLGAKIWSLSEKRLKYVFLNVPTFSVGQQVYLIDNAGDFTVKIYDDTLKTLRKGAALLSERYKFEAAITDDNKYIYIAGGNGFHGDGSIDKYDISRDKWSKAVDGDGQNKPYGEHREKFAAVVTGDELYLMGGYTKDIKRTGQVKIFNIRTGRISSGQNLLHARVDCCATTLYNGNVVCVVGGYNATAFLTTVECFDKREGKWSTGVIVPDMPTGASSFGFVTI